MTPLNQRQERLVARQGGATPARQQAKAIVESLSDLLWREHLDPRRRQLTRQGNPIQAPDDLHDGGSVLSRQAKGGIGGRGAIDK